MIIAIAVVVVVGWLLCALYAAGTDFAYFQGKFPTIAQENRRKDLAEAIGWGLIFGPVGAVVSLFFSGFNQYGWRLR